MEIDVDRWLEEMAPTWPSEDKHRCEHEWQLDPYIVAIVRTASRSHRGLTVGYRLGGAVFGPLPVRPLVPSLEALP